MGRGGLRPGAGRPKGSRSARTLDRERNIKEAAEVLESILPNAFKGDAHAFLMAVYKDPLKPLKDRLAAATAAIGYEKPKLGSVDVKAEVDAAVEVNRIELVPIAPRHREDEPHAVCAL